MEMKLDQQRIRALRLNLSWSQEKLAEAAGLNPRTIQRVEADGSASLHTRLRIAKALGVQPQELDGKPGSFAAGKDTGATQASAQGEENKQQGHAAWQPAWLAVHGHQLPLLLLITLVYLAWTPIYLSLSAANFHSASLGQYRLAPTLALCLLLALPWLAFAWFRQRKDMKTHLAYLAAILSGILLRAVQADLTRELLTYLLYFSGLALLYNHYRGGTRWRLIRHAFLACLAAYIVVWLLQERLSTFMLGAYVRWQADLDIPAPWVSFPRYVLRMLRELTQLFPMALVLLYDLGRPRRAHDAAPPAGNGSASSLAGAS